jgi:ketosteroid isomerase-like protein
MKRSIQRYVLFAVIILIAFNAAPLVAQEWSPEQQEVWTFVKDFWQKFADKDFEGWIADFADDYRGWNVGNLAPHTKKERLPWWRRFIEKETVVALQLFPLAIDMHGDIAIVFYTYEQVLEKKDGTELNEKGKWMDVYRKRQGRWQLIADSGGNPN